MSIKKLGRLKCNRNETSCEQNLFSRQFEISNWYEFFSPLMWTYSKNVEKMKAIQETNLYHFLLIKRKQNQQQKQLIMDLTLVVFDV